MSGTTGPKTPGATGSSRAAADGSGRVADLKAEVERVKGTVDEVKAEIAAATDDRRGGPATSVDDATTKAATLRQALERDVATLRSRVPEAGAVNDTVRTVGAAVGGGVLAIVTVVALLKRRGARREHQRAVREQAAALALELARIEREGGVDEPGEQGGSMLRWALIGTGIAAGAGAVAWQRARIPADVEDVFGAPKDDPLRPEDVTSAAGSDTTP